MFWFRLTIALGHKSVRDCQRHVSSHEFAEWMALATIEPFGDDLVDLQFAQLESLTASIHAKKGRRIKPGDFLLRQVPEQEEEELTPSQIYQRFKANLGL